MSDDTGFAFDYVVTDHDNKVRVDVTRSEKDDEYIQINLSHAKIDGPRIMFFLTIDAAAELGHALACCAAGDHPSQVGIGVELIRAIKGSQP